MMDLYLKGLEIAMYLSNVTANTASWLEFNKKQNKVRT